MKWILIIVCIVGAYGGVSVDHIEFNKKESCENAKLNLDKKSTFSQSIYSVCVEDIK